MNTTPDMATGTNTRTFLAAQPEYNDNYVTD